MSDVGMEIVATLFLIIFIPMLFVWEIGIMFKHIRRSINDN